MRTYITCCSILLIVISTVTSLAQNKKPVHTRPNIILIMTDDQGYGDFGLTGNHYVKTPHIDKLASKSTRLTNYHASPVCAPTRASLMTGRYHQRTGVHDTYNNGAIMAPDETTLAEILTQAGYQTAIAGKWHLGDNYTHRPSEQGFTYSLIHHGGGIGQPGDHLENFVRTDSSYFDPILYENNRPIKSKGYCSDVFTDAGIKFIHEHKSSPFFLYLAFNAPHTPLQVPQRYYDMYKDLKLDGSSDIQVSKSSPKMNEKDQEDARRAYAMISNIDDNVGRLLAVLKREGLEKNTIIIFTTDNGNQQSRFNTGLRGLKASVYEGGTRVVNLISGKNIVPENKQQDVLAAHIDMLPTILEATGTALPSDVKIDGLSIWQTILGNEQSRSRSFYNAWHRGWTEPYRSAAFYRGDYKLVGNNANGSDIGTFELYNMKTDRNEQFNIIASQRDIALSLKSGLDSVFADVAPNEKLNPQRIPVGTSNENPVVLTRQDWAGIGARNWSNDTAIGHWTVAIKETGYYNFKLINTKPIEGNVRALVRVGQTQRSVVVKTPAVSVTLEHVYLSAGDFDIESWFELNNQVTTPYYLEVFKQP